MKFNGKKKAPHSQAFGAYPRYYRLKYPMDNTSSDRAKWEDVFYRLKDFHLNGGKRPVVIDIDEGQTMQGGAPALTRITRTQYVQSAEDTEVITLWADGLYATQYWKITSHNKSVTIQYIGQQPLTFVRYSAVQNIKDEYKAMARANIGAAGATPSGDPMHYAYLTVPGVEYDEQTGLWSYYADFGGLTDITTEQMRQAYVFIGNNSVATYQWKEYRGRVVMSLSYSTSQCSFMCDGCFTLELVGASRFTDITTSAFFVPANTSSMFRNCQKLQTILPAISVNSSTALSNIGNFQFCYALHNVRINALRGDVSFQWSPLLSLESLQYIVNNAANTTSITITVHADVYAKLMDETNTEWHAVQTAAANKNIAFASA